MKKEELLKTLKPLIKECVREVIFEDGALSNIVAEVAQGLSRPTLVESAPPAKQHDNRAEQEALMEQRQREARDRQQQLLSAIGSDAYGGIDVFEGTAPLSRGGSVSEGPQSQGPLADMDPNDPGVDISSILGMAGGRWSAHIK
jgi:hypothetical protein